MVNGRLMGTSKASSDTEAPKFPKFRSGQGRCFAPPLVQQLTSVQIAVRVAKIPRLQELY